MAVITSYARSVRLPNQPPSLRKVARQACMPFCVYATRSGHASTSVGPLPGPDAAGRTHPRTP
ncbi:hypothetical protein FRAAL6097 [Frankia alni ACN14a]|uniref:Uncharacterized protein n=1 Tax=Frankia alni (strain DSM 45986 / CECT 9034 / ACN14a) TaxID=326424 RepID=Q0RAK0_FRAAA|nr:hypothetical protein FRAAL6097 [Frankia alni ACN14a]